MSRRGAGRAVRVKCPNPARCPGWLSAVYQRQLGSRGARQQSEPRQQVVRDYLEGLDHHAHGKPREVAQHLAGLRLPSVINGHAQSRLVKYLSLLKLHRTSPNVTERHRTSVSEHQRPQNASVDWTGVQMCFIVGSPVSLTHHNRAWHVTIASQGACTLTIRRNAGGWAT
jgi:hypothetical protein